MKLFENVRVTQVETENGKVSAVDTDRGRIQCQYFVNAAGMVNFVSL